MCSDLPGQSSRLQIPKQVSEQRDFRADSITQKFRKQRKGLRSKGNLCVAVDGAFSVHKNRKSE